MYTTIPHAISVIYVENAIQHAKHREHSPLRSNRGARKSESIKNVERPKSAKSAPAEERTSTCSRSPPTINYGKGRPCIEGIKSDASGVAKELARHGEPMRDLDDTTTPERDRTTTESLASHLRGSHEVTMTTIHPRRARTITPE